MASACLQIWWLDPELTYGSAKPFVFTQGHSVCNRSFFPCFDTPAVKCTYSAVVKVSAQLPAASRGSSPSGAANLGGASLWGTCCSAGRGPLDSRGPGPGVSSRTLRIGGSDGKASPVVGARAPGPEGGSPPARKRFAVWGSSDGGERFPDRCGAP